MPATLADTPAPPPTPTATTLSDALIARGAWSRLTPDEHRLICHAELQPSRDGVFAVMVDHAARVLCRTREQVTATIDGLHRRGVLSVVYLWRGARQSGAMFAAVALRAPRSSGGDRDVIDPRSALDLVERSYPRPRSECPMGRSTR